MEKQNTLLSRLTCKSVRFSSDLKLLEAAVGALDGAADPALRQVLDSRPSQRRNPAALALKGLHDWLVQARAVLKLAGGGNG